MHRGDLTVCEVCDRKARDLELVHGYPVHSKCAPAHWITDLRSREGFMRQVRDLSASRSARWQKWS